MLLCRQLSDCSEPLIFPARATLKARRGYELFREALVWPRRTRRSRLRVFVGMHSRSSETGLCSSPAAQQPKLASPRQTTERPNVCAGRRRSCGPVDAAQQHVGRWRCCCVAAKCGSPAYHAPLRSMGALKEGQSWTKACIGSVLNFPWSGAEGICLALRTKLGLAAPIRLPTPLATCKLILPFIAPPTRACICLALAP